MTITITKHCEHPTSDRGSFSKKKCQLPSTVIDRYFKKIMSCLYYHGTSKKSAKDICLHGMDIKRKKMGSTTLLENSTGLKDNNASQYNYVMNKESAARYAKMQNHPKIVRIIIPPSVVLEADPEGFAKDEQRTKNRIPSEFILPLKRSQLNREQVEKINKALGLPPLICCKKHLDKLISKIGSKIIENHKNKDQDVLDRVSDFVTMEHQRHEQTITMLKKQGVDISSFQEGDILSVVF